MLATEKGRHFLLSPKELFHVYYQEENFKALRQKKKKRKERPLVCEERLWSILLKHQEKGLPKKKKKNPPGVVFLYGDSNFTLPVVVMLGN